MSWPVRAVRPDLTVRVVRDRPSLSASLEAEVERHWQRALRGNPTLFNGAVYSADRVTPGLIEGHWTEYRRIVARMRDPDLVPDVRPLAVCGVLRSADGLVFGQRQPAVYQAGLWQLAPAGSVDGGAARPGGGVDWMSQFLLELREELGLPASQVGALRPLCLVEHPGSGVLDLAVAATTPLDAAGLAAAHAADGSDEYRRLRVTAACGAAALAGEGGLAPQTSAVLAWLAAGGEGSG